MDYKLAKEIYHTPWLMDINSFMSLSGLWEQLRSGNVVENDGAKLNNSFVCSVSDLKQNIAFVEDADTRQLKNAAPDAELINIINLDGPITKGGGVSTYGTKEMSSDFLRADADSRVLAHIMKADSGGGSGAAIEFMTDAMAQRTKPIVVFIEKNAQAGSAAYAIISASDFIISERKYNEVGSLGTYIEMQGFPKEAELPNGQVYVRIYAEDSDQKNEEFEAAINDRNFTPIIENTLNPFNDRFLDLVTSNRPTITKDQLRGRLFKAGEVVGSLVDAIGDFQSAVNKALELSTNFVPAQQARQAEQEQININNHKTMTADELKAQFPATYAEIYNSGLDAGVAQETDRVGSWMAHAETDLSKVTAGIAGGKEISATEREQFFVAQNAQKRITDMKSEAAPDVVPVESTNEEIEQPETKNEDKSKLAAEGFDFTLSSIK